MVSEIVFSDVLSMAQTIGIIGTLALTFFSMKQIQHLVIDTETKSLQSLNHLQVSFSSLFNTSRFEIDMPLFLIFPKRGERTV